MQVVKLIPSHLETVRMHPRCHLRQNRRPYAAAALLSLPHHLQCSSSPVGLPCQAQSAPNLHAFNEQHIIAVHPLQQRWTVQNLTRHPFTPSTYCLQVCAERLLKLNVTTDMQSTCSIALWAENMPWKSWSSALATAPAWGVAHRRVSADRLLRWRACKECPLFCGACDPVDLPLLPAPCTDLTGMTRRQSSADRLLR